MTRVHHLPLLLGGIQRLVEKHTLREKLEYFFSLKGSLIEKADENFCVS